MPRTDLKVPFPKKDEAKKLGAKWDAEKKVWYVPDGLAIEPFALWIPIDTQKTTVRAKNYYIAEAQRACWKCAKLTHIYCIFLPTGYESLDFFDDDNGNEVEQWQSSNEPSSLSYVLALPEHAKEAFNALTPKCFMDRGGLEHPYWMNHCEHCQAKLGDHFTVEEMDTPFNPQTIEGAKTVTLHFIDKRFEGNGSPYETNTSMTYFNI